MQVQTNAENSKMYRLHPGLTAHSPLLPSSRHVAKELLPCHDENYGGQFENEVRVEREHYD